MPDDLVCVRYIVDDVDAAIDFYTEHFGFTVLTSFPRVRRRRPGPAAAAAQRPRKLRRAPDARWPLARARWLEPHPPDRR